MLVKFFNEIDKTQKIKFDECWCTQLKNVGHCVLGNDAKNVIINVKPCHNKKVTSVITQLRLTEDCRFIAIIKQTIILQANNIWTTVRTLLACCRFGACNFSLRALLILRQLQGKLSHWLLLKYLQKISYTPNLQRADRVRNII